MFTVHNTHKISTKVHASSLCFASISPVADPGFPEGDNTLIMGTHQGLT